jgi:hypothetical protein
MDYSCRSPMTGSHRTVLCHESEAFSNRSQILSALGVEDSTTRFGCISNLQAAVEMAKIDASSRSWLRTREQVDGGAHGGVSGITTKAHTVSVASATSAEDKPPLRPEALSRKDLQALCSQYHDDQNAFERHLLLFRDHVHSNKRSRFESLFNLQSDNRLLVADNYPTAFRMINEVSSITAKLLRNMIANREKSRRHYQSLSGCEEENKRHRDFPQKLKEGEAILFGPKCPGLGTCTFCQKRIAEKHLIEVEGWEVARGNKRRKIEVEP